MLVVRPHSGASRMRPSSCRLYHTDVCAAVNEIFTATTWFRTVCCMAKQRHEDPVMQAVRERVKKSGLTYTEIGQRMGYAPQSARQAVSQFLKSGDPQIGMLRRFANAMGISLVTLLKDSQ